MVTRSTVRFLVSVVLLVFMQGAQAREVYFTILHTTDLRGQLRPLSEGRQEDEGGLLRCATRINALRQAHPNTLLIDCGNLFVGSRESYTSKGHAVLKAVEAMQYDAWVVGQHDFDWGLDAFKRLHDACRVPILSANLSVRTGRLQPLKKVEPFIVREIDGIKVAIVGLTCPIVALYQRPELLGYTEFRPSVEALNRAMQSLRPHDPDVVILSANQGLLLYDDAGNQLQEVARLFPEFEVILGGQTGQDIEARRLQSALYTQAGRQGLFVGEVNIVYDTVTRTVKSRTSRLHPIDRSIPEDGELRELLRTEIQRTEVFETRPVGRLSDETPATAGKGSERSFQRIICEGIKAKTGADIVLHAMLTDSVLPVGEVTVSDLWTMMPYDSRIATIKITMADLDRILEENAGYAGTEHFMGMLGAKYELNAHAPRNERVNNLSLLDGSSAHPRRRFTVAVNTYLLASAGGRLKVLREIAETPDARLSITEFDIRTAVIEYLRANSPL